MSKCKISPTQKILTIISSVVTILCACGKWLKLNQIPIFFFDTEQIKYSLFDISDLINMFNQNITKNYKISFYSGLLAFCAVLIIVLCVAYIIMMLADVPPNTVYKITATVLTCIIAVAFLIVVFNIDNDLRRTMRSATPKLLSATSMPYLTVIFMLLTGVCASVKETSGVSNNLPQLICPRCGTEIQPGSTFCNNCAARAVQPAPVQNALFCKSCGSKINADSEFCPTCGNKIK